MCRFSSIYEIHYFWQILDIFFKWCIYLFIDFIFYFYFHYSKLCFPQPLQTYRLFPFVSLPLWKLKNFTLRTQTQLHTNNPMKPRLWSFPFHSMFLIRRWVVLHLKCTTVRKWANSYGNLGPDIFEKDNARFFFGNDSRTRNDWIFWQVPANSIRPDRKYGPQHTFSSTVIDSKIIFS